MSVYDDRSRQGQVRQRINQFEAIGQAPGVAVPRGARPVMAHAPRSDYGAPDVGYQQADVSTFEPYPGEVTEYANRPAHVPPSNYANIPQGLGVPPPAPAPAPRRSRFKKFLDFLLRR